MKITLLLFSVLLLTPTSGFSADASSILDELPAEYFPSSYAPILSSIKKGEETKALTLMEKIERELLRSDRISKTRRSEIPRLLLLRGIVFLEEKRNNEAIGAFRAAIQENPSSSLLYFLLGIAYRDADEVDKADAAFQEALWFNRFDGLKSNRVQLELAELARARGDVAVARQLLTQAQVSDPTYLPSLSALTNLELQSGNKVAAIGLARQALAQHSDPSISLDLAQALLINPDPVWDGASIREALKLAQSVSQTTNDSELLRRSNILQIQALLALKEIPKAEQQLRAQLKRLPADADLIKMAKQLEITKLAQTAATLEAAPPK